ncbi:MAG: trimeric intracellular cation channel family protein [Cellvibrionales bacterium]|nr:trimeric intracellular cation channel family protein [Cellvibrionales bacterium]
MHPVLSIIHYCDMLAVGVFALSGALAAAEKRLDIFGFALLAIVTGIGGGTVRDVLLNTPHIFWVENSIYLLICLTAAGLTYCAARLLTSLRTALLWMDAAGLALFSVLGCSKALQLGADPLVAVAMGVVTATFGSVIRDILLNREPVLFGPQIYVSCALLGSLVCTLLLGIGVPAATSLFIAIAAAFLLRAVAILFDLRLPKYRH